jgi:hypothetical protein
MDARAGAGRKANVERVSQRQPSGEEAGRHLQLSTCGEYVHGGGIWRVCAAVVSGLKKTDKDRKRGGPCGVEARRSGVVTSSQAQFHSSYHFALQFTATEDGRAEGRYVYHVTAISIWTGFLYCLHTNPNFVRNRAPIGCLRRPEVANLAPIKDPFL